jgi:flagellum-specific peptidoglycan hydrolase FlgJ
MAILDAVFADKQGQTPQDIERRRRMALELLAKSQENERITSPWQGAAKVAQALVGGYEEARANSDDKANRANANALLTKTLLGEDPAAPSGAIPTPGAAREISSTAPSVDLSGDKQSFIDNLLPAAIEEGKRTGVDPRIIVAQAAQETGWGKSAPGNNFFGIKSHGKPGGNNLMTTEYVNGSPVRTRDSFRAFDSPTDSVRGYGDFILQNPRYTDFRNAKGLDAQLDALGKSGYATDPTYAQSIGSIARSINLPTQVASLDPSSGMSSPAPTQGPTQAAPTLPPPTTIASAPQVASVPQQQSIMGSPVPGQQQAPQMLAQAQPNRRAQIAALLQNPYTQEMGQQMLMEEYQRQQDADNLILKQKLQQSDPKYQTELQKSQIELQNLREPKFDDISGMRKEIQQLPSYKNLAAAAPIYKAMAETAGRNSKASDLNLVYGLGKIMDPTSVVREGEMIMVKNTASLPDWLQGAIASLNGGAALTPETRQAIMTEAYGRVKGYNDEFQQNMGQYQGIVQRNGINPADVIPDIDKFEPWKAPEGTPAPAQSIGNDWQEISPGVRIRKKAQ